MHRGRTLSPLAQHQRGAPVVVRVGMERHPASVYLSAATDFDISQVVDLVTGVHARIRKADFEEPAR
ncbi:hypothetical protein [Curtobacterium sp. MCPF17_018]|uniref:hypothetical protein n=1 Tax=Curtobacterium sp. MCPF17_018 TaxID=2175638 RepID=UPI0011B610BB|nr:hypothetical protein [Curtobacterium sp. MCPF17_018]